MVQEIVPDLYSSADTYFRFNPNAVFEKYSDLDNEEQKQKYDRDYEEIKRKEDEIKAAREQCFASMGIPTSEPS